jgi:hypothetical protein
VVGVDRMPPNPLVGVEQRREMNGSNPKQEVRKESKKPLENSDVYRGGFVGFLS